MRVVSCRLLRAHTLTQAKPTQGIKPPVLIFVQSKDRAKELFRELIYENLKVDVIHSERTQAQVNHSRPGAN